MTRDSAQKDQRAGEFLRFKRAVGPITVDALLLDDAGDPRLLEKVRDLVKKHAMLSAATRATRERSW